MLEAKMHVPPMQTLGATPVPPHVTPSFTSPGLGMSGPRSTEISVQVVPSPNCLVDFEYDPATLGACPHVFLPSNPARHPNASSVGQSAFELQVFAGGSVHMSIPQNLSASAHATYLSFSGDPQLPYASPAVLDS
jgi:hypothetical protein